MAAASQILGQRSHSRAVSSRNTSSLARSGNMVSPVSAPFMGPKTTKGMRRPHPLRKPWLTGRMSRLLAFNLNLEFLFENVRGAGRRSGVLVLLPALF